MPKTKFVWRELHDPISKHPIGKVQCDLPNWTLIIMINAFGDAWTANIEENRKANEGVFLKRVFDGNDDLETAKARCERALPLAQEAARIAKDV